jgi:2,4-dienoyl-CoA reductase-like NADH-dependent reductase (Old Yellow Enzyme family)
MRLAPNQVVGIKTMAVGLITNAAQVASYLEAEDCDFVALAREMLWNPNWPAHAARELGLDKPHELLPLHYAWWLQKREETLKASANADQDQFTGLT